MFIARLAETPMHVFVSILHLLNNSQAKSISQTQGEADDNSMSTVNFKTDIYQTDMFLIFIFNLPVKILFYVKGPTVLVVYQKYI